MTWEIIENLEDEVWERTLSRLPDGAELLQSGLWEKIALAEKRVVRRFAWQTQNKIVVLAQILESSRAGFKFWYLPRGPICLQPDQAETIWPRVIADLKAQARRAGITALRFEPENWFLSSNIFGRQIKPIQPAKSLFLDLSKSQEALWAQMHPKTRYNIRLAEKKGVEIYRGCKSELSSFLQLLQVTTKRDRFRGHSQAHYQHLLVEGEPAIELWLARRAGKIIAGGIFSFYQGRAVYLHGASADTERQYMAPHLLQAQMILRAKEKGCRYYDFYGIDEQKWPGVTRFKRGFGGEERTYPGTFNLIISRWRYFLYLFLSRLVRLFRS